MLIEPVNKGKRINLYSPVAMPKAAAFLWNSKMMIHINCRGFAVAQFMQPEPAKYAHAPNLEAKTFMQPEQPYYAHHPGRFCYINDLDNHDLFSIPYEPVKSLPEKFCFSAGQSDVYWIIEKNDLQIKMKLHLTADDVAELWSIEIENRGATTRNLKIFPYFPVGYMSWMNQSARYDAELNAIICSSISPYQKYQDYDQVKNYKDKTFLLASEKPFAYETCQEAFEGEGGLQYPSAIRRGDLQNSTATYETPTCAMQYNISLGAGEVKTYKFIFGPAKDISEIQAVRDTYLNKNNNFDKAFKTYDAYVRDGGQKIIISTPNKHLDNFVNSWLPRQIYYHGETNRLSTDPQTRNYLQDNMGMGYLKPLVARKAFITALKQQESSGAMPDGILIKEGAELKYINQVPHTDHCVWLPICLKAYLDETNDRDLLFESIGFADAEEKVTVIEHIDRAMRWLLLNRDERQLNFINQGDWCDPMNMVGYKGKGVSGWLSMATSYALKIWLEICESFDIETDTATFTKGIESLHQAIDQYLWDGHWFARGITDANVVFGIKKDPEGRIFLNPQAWSMLCGVADPAQEQKIISAVENELETPYGVEMLSPSYTSMRKDVGRVTQKHPGSAENGSVYNHAAAFYIFALYSKGHKDKAFRLLEKMIPKIEDAHLLQKGQLPVFVPNYYRGAYKQFPQTAGRSSQLFNTGTVHWIYRILIDGLFGLQGDPKGLKIDPQLPAHWDSVKITRNFRGAEFNFHMHCVKGIKQLEVFQENKLLKNNCIECFETGKTYRVEVRIPC